MSGPTCNATRCGPGTPQGSRFRPRRPSPTGSSTRGARDGNLYAFDAGGVTNCAGGVCEPLWTAYLGTFTSPPSSPAVAGGVVYIGSTDGKLSAFDAAGATNCSGNPKVCQPLWTATTGAAARSTPAIAKGTVYIGSDDGKLYAFDAPGSTNCSGAPKVCQPLWTAQPAQLIRSSPSIAYGKVYIGASGLFAYDAAGVTNCSGAPKVCQPLWSAPTNGDISGSPAVAANRVFIGDISGRLYEFDALGGVDHCTGTPVVCQPLGSLHTTAGIESSVALVGPKLLYVLDAAGGTSMPTTGRRSRAEPNNSPCGPTASAPRVGSSSRRRPWPPVPCSRMAPPVASGRSSLHRRLHPVPGIGAVRQLGREVSSGEFVVVGVSVRPGGVLVVAGSVVEAAVEDADEAVAERAEGLVVQITGGASLVVEGPAAGAVGQRAEGPLIDRVVEAAVADVAGEHRAFLARRDGEG